MDARGHVSHFHSHQMTGRRSLAAITLLFCLLADLGHCQDQLSSASGGLSTPSPPPPRSRRSPSSHAAPAPAPSAEGVLKSLCMLVKADADCGDILSGRHPSSHAKAPSGSNTRVSVQSTDFQSEDLALPPASFDPYTGAQTGPSSGEIFIGALPSGKNAPPAESPTSCQIKLKGSGSGGDLQQPLSSASIICSGPGTPISLTGSAALLKFAGNFQGVKFSQASSDLDSVLQIVGLYGLEIYNSVFDGLPASLRIASSSVQLTNSNFTNIQGNTAGGLIIDQAVVDINACKFSDSQSQSGGAIFAGDTSNITISSSLFQNNQNSQSIGGAISAIGNSDISVEDSSFIGNSAKQGGAIGSSSSTISVTSTVFTTNSAGTTGGALQTTDGSSNIQNCTFSYNSAGQLGGASSADGTNTAVSECLFTGNRAQSQGGGLYESGCSGSIENSVFYNNSALNGGGLYQNLGSGKLSGNRITNNTAGSNGGGVYQQSHNGDVSGNTFSNNFAQSTGGGMYQNQATSTVDNCTFDGNTGGGLYRNTCTGKISNAKFTDNQGKQGGGIYQDNCDSNDIENCTFNNNSANQGSAAYLNNSVPKVSGTTVDGSSNLGAAFYRNTFGDSTGEDTSNGGQSFGAPSPAPSDSSSSPDSSDSSSDGGSGGGSSGDASLGGIAGR